MKNKIWLLLLIPILIFSGFGCVTDSSAPAADSLVSKINGLTDTVGRHTTVIDQLRVEVDKKATKTEIDDLNRKINNLPQSGTTPTNTYTKTEVDQKIADAITALKNEKPWVTGTSSGGIINPGDNVLATSGSLVLSLERSVDDELYMADADHQTFRLTITNNDTTSHSFRLKADFDCDNAVKLGTGTKLDSSYSYSESGVMKSNIVLPTSGTVTNIGFTSYRGSSSTDTTWYIGKSRSEDIYLTLTVDYFEPDATAQRWSWDFGITERE